MNIEHNSHNLFCRTPFGAAPCACKVTLRALVKGQWPEYITLHTQYENNSYFKKMYYVSKLMDAYVFETTIELPKEPCLLLYYFEIKSSESVVYYGNNSSRLGGIGSIYDKDPIPYQITVYKNDYKTPDWMKKGVMYQIFVDRFYKSESFDNINLRSDIIKRNWGETAYYLPEQFGGKYLANDFFGGSLVGITEKLDYLKDLGVDILYLNPIFEAYSNHKYDTGNYEKVDKMFGGDEAFFTLCKEAKKRGMKIILDGVFNHTGSDSKYFNKNGSYDSIGAYQSKESKYYDWYNFENYPDEYESWWGIKTLPSVNEKSQSYKEYMLTGENAIVKKWLKAGADGWRLDVADELPSDFVEELRRQVKLTNPDAAIIGEVWEDASNKISYSTLRKYLCGNQLDSAMNYPLKNAMIDYILCRIDGCKFNKIIYSLYENYPREAFMAMMNFLSSHDTMRVFTALADVPEGLERKEQALYKLSDLQRENAYKRFKLIYFLLMCLPGMPSIFYGDENAQEGFGDPFCRGCFDWSKTDGEMHSFFKSLIKMRKESGALLCGDFETVFGEGQVCGFLRKYKDETKLILINSSPNHDWHAPIELGKFKIEKLFNQYEKHSSDNGRFNLHINPMSIKIYDAKRGERL